MTVNYLVLVAWLLLIAIATAIATALIPPAWTYALVLITMLMVVFLEDRPR